MSPVRGAGRGELVRLHVDADVKNALDLQRQLAEWPSDRRRSDADNSARKPLPPRAPGRPKSQGALAPFLPATSLTRLPKRFAGRTRNDMRRHRNIGRKSAQARGLWPVCVGVTATLRATRRSRGAAGFLEAGGMHRRCRIQSASKPQPTITGGAPGDIEQVCTRTWRRRQVPAAQTQNQPIAGNPRYIAQCKSGLNRRGDADIEKWTAHGRNGGADRQQKMRAGQGQPADANGNDSDALHDRTDVEKRAGREPRQEGQDQCSEQVYATINGH